MSQIERPITSIVRCESSSCMMNFFLSRASLVSFSLKTKVSSTIPGIRVSRCVSEKAGANHPRCCCHSLPRVEKRLLEPVNPCRKSMALSKCKKSACEYVCAFSNRHCGYQWSTYIRCLSSFGFVWICAASAGSVITTNEWLAGQLSR